MSAPVDHALATRLQQAETRWLAQCAARLRQARAPRRPETTAPGPGTTGGER